MSIQFSIPAAVAVVALALSACGSREAPSDARLTQPLPPPGPISPVGSASAVPVAGAQDNVLRGAAFAQDGDGRFPPNSQLIVRVYDAASGQVNNPVAEQSFSRSGAMPWPYEMRVPAEDMRGLIKPAVAARIEGPRGQLIYRSAEAVLLSDGGSEDIPMSRVGGGGALTELPDAYEGAPVAKGAQSLYGIPDSDASYGTPNYDTPVYPGQTFDSPSLSGPPSNATF